MLRPRTAAEILDGAFQLLRAHYAPLVSASLVLVAPFALLEIAVPEPARWMTGLLTNLALMAGNAATVLIVAYAYLGRPIGAMAAVRTVLARFPSVWGAAFLQGIAVIVGFLLLVIPGFVALAWTFAMPMVVMVEGVGAGDAFERSKSLVRGDVLRVLGILALAYALYFVAILGISLTLGFILGALGAGDTLLEALGGVLAITFYPLIGVVGTLLYFDLRIRKEAFDLEVLLDDEVEELPAAPALT
ncbi:MAG TPA: hypothetical protein VGR37_13800 [Longimicrobiaceae bacterium]|nr:hypothetical protein [Longimicrobiaceae bacterium]